MGKGGGGIVCVAVCVFMCNSVSGFLLLFSISQGILRAYLKILCCFCLFCQRAYCLSVQRVNNLMSAFHFFTKHTLQNINFIKIMNTI